MRSVFWLKTVNMKNLISKILLALMVLLFAGCGEWVDPKDLVSGNAKPDSGSDSPGNEAELITYKVGDYYNVNGKQGVVFWVDETGQHGKIVSLAESTSELEWSSDVAELKRLIGADYMNNGANNMAFVKQISGWKSKYPAFKWCADLGGGWYLPAIEELKIFTLDESVHDAVNKTLATKGVKLANIGDNYAYWSSTEHDYQYSTDYFCAWRVGMYRGDTYVSAKGYGGYVRAVSAF